MASEDVQTRIEEEKVNGEAEEVSTRWKTDEM
jgi:hypothetical protein